jgi:hypothetical protein
VETAPPDQVCQPRIRAALHRREHLDTAVDRNQVDLLDNFATKARARQKLKITVPDSATLTRSVSFEVARWQRTNLAY